MKDDEFAWIDKLRYVMPSVIEYSLIFLASAFVGGWLIVIANLLALVTMWK